MQDAASGNDASVTLAHQLKQWSKMPTKSISIPLSAPGYGFTTQFFTSFSSSRPHDAAVLASNHLLFKYQAKRQHAQVHGPAPLQHSCYCSKPIEQPWNFNWSSDQQEQLGVSCAAGCS
jgi:hypothetical protein